MAKSVYSNKDEQKIAEELIEQYHLSKLYLDPIHERFNKQEELYRSFIDKNNYEHGAMVFDPRVFNVIETVTPRMVANEPTGSFYPVESGDIITTQILNALVKYDWRRADMFPKLVMFVKSLLIFGTSFGRTHWDFRERERTRMVPKEINGRMVWSPKNKEKIMVTEFDGPNFETLNIYDCFPDPNATSMDNMRWFIYRTFKTIDELENENEMRGTEYYKNLDELKRLMGENKENGEKGTATGGGVMEDMQYREHRRLMLSTQEFRNKDESNPEIVILKRFTREGWCDVVPAYNLVIREVENPYFHGEIPIIHGVDYPYPGELYGMGEIEPVERIQRAINAVLNQRLDNVELTLNTMWKVKKTGGVDMHTLVSSPGNVVTTEEMDAVEPLVTPDVTGTTFVQTMNYLTSAMQNGSGITDYTSGINSSSNTANQTATGTRLIQQEANARFKLKIQLFNHMVIQKVANQWKDLRIQYTTEAQKLRIIGAEQVKYLLQNTQLATTPMNPDDGEVIPGDTETQTKLTVSQDQGFAFLHLMPEDIQPSVVGDYDFIATVSQDQLNDPIALQENFFTAIDKVSTPIWIQGLAQQKKMLNYSGLTTKVFDKLQLSIDEKDVLTDVPMDQQQTQVGADGMPVPQDGQPIEGESIQNFIGQPRVNPFQVPGQEQGGQVATA